MAIILDADVVIRGEKGTFDFQSWAASRPDDQFEIAAITVAELWHESNGLRVSQDEARTVPPDHSECAADHSLHGTDSI